MHNAHLYANFHRAGFHSLDKIEMHQWIVVQKQMIIKNKSTLNLVMKVINKTLNGISSSIIY